MCFSAEASFVSGTILTAVGAVALKQVKVPNQYAFASVPLVFGLQQLAEGMVWLSFADPVYSGLQKTGMYLFLFVARIVWPALMPFAVLMMEEQQKKKMPMKILLAMGLSVSIYYSYCLLFMNVAPTIAGNHVQYISDFPEWLAVPVFFIYFFASITPIFISSVPRMPIFGALLFIACAVTGIFYFEYLTSVWCFFAAIISVVILWIMRGKSNIELTIENG